MNYKVVEVESKVTSHAESLMLALQDPSVEGYVLHSVIPVTRDGSTTQFLLVLQTEAIDHVAMPEIRGVPIRGR